MRTRNALLALVAALVTAATASAQQPRSKPTPRTNAAAAKSSAKTAAATALPVTPDSARKVVLANASGASVASVRLHRAGGKPYYAVSYHMKGEKSTMHANVDANTGAFSASAPAATPTRPSTSRPSPKRPS